MSRFPRVPRSLAVALGLMLFVSCANPLLVCGCSYPPPGAAFNGRVTRPDGSPVAFATLIFQAGPAGCAEPFTSAGGPRTEADGRYSWIVQYEAHPPDGCVRVFATPPVNETSLRASDTVTVPVRFDNEPESMRLDFVLRAR